MLKEEKNPIKLFEIWFKEAEATGMDEPEAVNLATATKDGKPSNRMVLLKQFDEKGFVFFTNLESRKGMEIKENPFASMCFFWPEINKQVRIEGKLEPVSDIEADNYFDSRPLNSRIGALISKQSQPILENDFTVFKNTFIEAIGKIVTTQSVTRPEYWSGFRLVPQRIEFWQKGEFRIHKRTQYFRNKTKWEIGYLYP